MIRVYVFRLFAKDYIGLSYKNTNLKYAVPLLN